MIITGSLTIILYLTSGILLLLKLNSYALVAGLSRFQLLLPALIAVLLHGWLVYQGLLTPQGLDVGFFSVLSLVGCLVALLLLSATISQPIESLGIFVFPAAALMLALRLCFADAGIVLSTRESAGFRDHAMNICVTRVSAGSRTNPGGYASVKDAAEQFAIDDSRIPHQIAEMIRSHGYEPVWKDWDAAFSKSEPSTGR